MALDLDQIRALADRVARSHGLDVVDIEYQGGGGKYRTLRIFIEKNAEERAKLLALAAAKPRPMLEEVDDEEFADEEEFEDGEEDREQDREQDGELGDEVDAEPDDEDDDEYDHDAFLASLPSVANLEHLSGVTHGDCEQFSRDFGTVLDVEELVPGMEYLLEVSSPGLDRRLQKQADFARFVGSLVKLQTFEPVGGNRHWQGRLTDVAEDMVTLTPSENSKDRHRRKNKKDAQPEPVAIRFSNVEKANLVPEF